MKYFMTFLAILSGLLAGAQQPDAPATANVDTLFVFLVVTAVALFLFVVTLALARAVKALSSQVHR